MATSRERGLNMGLLDGFIAATAIARETRIMTRNIRHFGWCGVPVVDPWLTPEPL